MSLLALLSLSLLAPHSYMMLLASSELGFVIVRGGLAALLIALFIYQPPRRPEFRITLAGIGAMLLTWAMMIFVTSQTNVLDALLFMEMGILLFIEAAELGVETKEVSSKVVATRKVRRVPVQSAA